MEFMVSSFDDSIMQSIYRLADALKCTPVDVLDFILRCCTVMSVILGLSLMMFFDYFLRPVVNHALDRLFDGVAAFIRWLCSRKKNKL